MGKVPGVVFEKLSIDLVLFVYLNKDLQAKRHQLLKGKANVTA